LILGIATPFCFEFLNHPRSSHSVAPWGDLKIQSKKERAVMQKTNFRTYELALDLYHECAGVKAAAVIRNQLERASLSIVLNLAEGAAKPTVADKRRFFAIV
jgi:hypothetical protein